MDINQLVFRLKNGDNYTAHPEDGDPYQVIRPPSSLTMRAADFIVKQDQQLQQYMAIIQNLQYQLQVQMQLQPQASTNEQIQVPDTPATPQ